MIRVSVVLPCWNARATLARALEALAAQDVAPGTFEVVIVDDGSTDDTAAVARQAATPFPLRVIRQPNRGLAAARNAGAALATGEILLFLDPDVFADPGLVAAHLRHYRGTPERLAVQGRTIPDPDALVTLFMQSTHCLPDLTVRRREDLSPFHVVGRNFSIHRTSFEALGGFDEGFVGYGWEDVEFALRFRRAGGRIRYDPEALGIHHHPLTLDAAVNRQRQNGRAAVYFWCKHRRSSRVGIHLEVHPLLLPLKWLVFRTGLARWLVQPIRAWAEPRRRYLVLNECYNNLLWDAYYEGVFEALHERRRPGRTGSRRPP
jgi:GT2 family glycosyltransferase